MVCAFTARGRALLAGRFARTKVLWERASGSQPVTSGLSHGPGGCDKLPPAKGRITMSCWIWGQGRIL